MTKKNKEIAKYRVWGMLIIFLALFGFSFSILLYQEFAQRQAYSIYSSLSNPAN